MRDIGVRTAMVQWVFITALTLVSALALALVYGLGGCLRAARARWTPGAVVALALLLTRLYAPLTALASARVEVMSALVSFERVFEVLDLKPLIAEKPDARPVPDGPVSVEFDDVRFAYPSADKVSLASLEEVADARHPRRRRGAARRLVPRRARPDGRAGRLVRRRQVDHRAAAAAAVRRRRGRRAARRRRRPRPDRRRRCAATLGMVTQDGHLFHESVRANLLLARPEATEDELWDVLRRARLDDLVAVAARTGWTPSSASAATGSPAASASG